jgi:hypothetical protein
MRYDAEGRPQLPALTLATAVEKTPATATAAPATPTSSTMHYQARGEWPRLFTAGLMHLRPRERLAIFELLVSLLLTPTPPTTADGA